MAGGEIIAKLINQHKQRYNKDNGIVITAKQTQSTFLCPKNSEPHSSSKSFPERPFLMQTSNLNYTVFFQDEIMQPI